MTQNTDTDTDSRIARRTALSLAGGAMASLAGCFSGGGSGSPEGPPEERSDQIQSTEITAQDSGPRYPEITLTIEMVEAGWNSVALLTEEGDNFYTSEFTENERLTTIPLLTDTGTIGPAPPGEHTLIFERQNGDEHRVVFSLSGSMEFVEALSYEESDKISGVGDFALVFRNTGQQPDAIDIETSQELTEDDIQILSDNAKLISKDETVMLVYSGVLIDTNGPCNEDGRQDRDFTIEFLWSDPITVSVPIEYISDMNSCTGDIVGTVEERTAEQQAQ